MTLLDEPNVRLILLDIEGTTTPIEFVTQVLFPYASRKLESFLRENFHDPQIQSLIRGLRAQHREDERLGLEPPAWAENSVAAELETAIAYTRWLMRKDSKCTALKALQGKIWQKGYANRELRGQLYPDVPPAMERWRQQKREICIYSSGSVLAQRLLFQTTTFGDLTSYIRDFFDTRIGEKADSESYKRIAALLDRAPRELLFLSDAGKEIEAASAAGCLTALCDRSRKLGAGKLGSRVIRTFDEVFPD
ncbi:MAG: acireductone synthase [Candidatus Acidiferrales bacterium]